ncbi:23 kDa jasmonate-induced protein-like [Argentina anserina]|uniref:23 kDa jasmonate-induced protein-like n=1 Tax=Argentina anserina TaxID=57926 RepID=UPI002176691C|nr:23 kDa jasmonate-induced protein-like [Potentilla anserina]
MANVFGTPISSMTDSTIRAISGCVCADMEITAADRARAAIYLKAADMKDRNARTYVDNLKSEWGIGVSTLCLVYNATGNTIAYVGDHNFHGHIGPAPYPAKIENGQWGAILHVKTSLALAGSEAAVVYRGSTGKGTNCDFMMAWCNPWRRQAFNNSVWVKTRGVDHFARYSKENWDSLYAKLDVTRYYHSDAWEGCLSTISTGSATSPVVETIFTLEGADA